MMCFFAGLGFEVIGFEGPGQGAALRRHGLPLTYEWEKPAGAVLDHFGIRKCTLAGMSMGGWFALRAAALEPRVERVIASGHAMDYMRCMPSAFRWLHLWCMEHGRGFMDRMAELKFENREGMAPWAVDHMKYITKSTSAYVINPSLLVEKLCRREGLVTLWDLPDLLIAQSQGRPLSYRFPESGTVVIDDAIALVRGAKHEVAARAYIEFVGTIEAQILTAKESFRLPARLDLPAERVPEWVTRVDREMKTAPVNWALQAREGAAWMAEWDRRVRGAGRKAPEKAR